MFIIDYFNYYSFNIISSNGAIGDLNTSISSFTEYTLLFNRVHEWKVNWFYRRVGFDLYLLYVNPMFLKNLIIYSKYHWFYLLFSSDTLKRIINMGKSCQFDYILSLLIKESLYRVIQKSCIREKFWYSY